MSKFDNYELEIDDNDTDILTKKDGVIDKMKRKELLRYGSLINDSDVAFCMDIEKDEIADGTWEFVKLQFREIIKSQGFYVTARGRDNNIYILLPHEMPVHNEKKAKAAYRNLRQRTRALNMIDQSILSVEQQKKLEFEIFRNAKIELEMSSDLKKRCRY